MAAFSGLAIGLSFLFGCVLLGFLAELCYLLWRKRRREDIENQNFSPSNYTPADLLSSCFKNPNSSKIPKTQEKKDLQNSSDGSENHGKQQDSELGLGIKDLPLKGLGEESLDLELMRLHNLCGPPRFLFTINEETKEDLESERSRKGSRTRSLSDLLLTLDTPLSSPAFKTQQPSNLEAYLNPLYDFDSNEFEFNKMRSSPPPTFKFLRDAEEKLLRRLMQLEAEKRAGFKKDQDSSPKTEERDDSFSKLVGSEGKSEEGIHHHHHHHQNSTPSQVLPLASSPSK